MGDEGLDGRSSVGLAAADFEVVSLKMWQEFWDSGAFGSGMGWGAWQRKADMHKSFRMKSLE